MSRWQFVDHWPEHFQLKNGCENVYSSAVRWNEWEFGCSRLVAGVGLSDVWVRAEWAGAMVSGRTRLLCPLLQPHCRKWRGLGTGEPVLSMNFIMCHGWWKLVSVMIHDLLHVISRHFVKKRHLRRHAVQCLRACMCLPICGMWLTEHCGSFIQIYFQGIAG